MKQSEQAKIRYSTESRHRDYKARMLIESRFPMFIRLAGITRKGKNRINEHGDLWNVIKFVSRVPCLNNSGGYLIESVKDNDLRWIRRDSDTNFHYEIVEDNEHV